MDLPRKTSEHRATARSFHLRVLFIIIVALAPVYFIVIGGHMEDRRRAEKVAEHDAGRILHIAKQGKELLVESTRQHLTGFGGVDLVRDPARSADCSAFFADLLPRFGYYANFGAISLDGTVRCSALAVTPGVNVSDRPYFQQALATRDFAVGDFQIGRLTGKPTINFGYPVYGQDGELNGVVFAALSLQWLNGVAVGVELPEDAVLAMFDRNGVILTRLPGGAAWIGQDARDSELFRHVRNEEDSFMLMGLDGIERLYRSESIAFGDVEDPSAYIVMGFATEHLYADAAGRFRRDMSGLFAVTLASILCAWIVGRSLIVSRVRALEEIDRLKNEFVDLASHQLRTPLTAIKWTLEDAARARMPKPAKESVELAREATDSLLELVTDLLNVSRFEAGRLTFKPIDMDLSELAVRAVAEVEPIAKKRRIKIALTAPPTRAFADPKPTHEMLINFVSNAVKYTPEGGSVSVTVRTEGQAARAEVRDTGVGIPEEEQARIFGRFFRAQNAAAFTDEGTGLGLYIVKLFAERQGGRVGFSSEEGKGSVFWFELPAKG